MKLRNAVLSLLPCVFLLTQPALAEEALPLTKAGELHILSAPVYPPMEFMNPETNEMDGFDIDLAKAIAKKMNLKPVFVETAFVDFKNSLQTGRGDFVISGMSDTVPRQEAMDLLSYLATGPILITRESNKDTFKTETDLCGKKVAGSRSTNFPENLAKWSDENCVAKGKQAIEVIGAANSNDARLGLRQNRYDGVVQGAETVGWLMKSEPGQFTPVGNILFKNDYYAIGFKKENNKVRDAVKAAFIQVIADGTYAQYLKKWGLEDNDVVDVQINRVK